MSACGINAQSFYRIQNRKQGFVFSQKVLISLALFSFNQRQAAFRRRFQYFYSLNCTVGLGFRNLSRASSLKEQFGHPFNYGFNLLSDGDKITQVNDVAEEQWRILKRRH